MLNSDALSQLKGLKSQMESAKERAEAVIKGTQARYGFAVLDDGREIFVPPDEMLKAFPDDRVRVCIRPAADKRSVAEVEKLIASPLGEFNGQCVRKGKAIFVRPDAGSLQRWLFIPPHARNGIQEGDYARCAILRHPIRDGKPQAKVLRVLGNAQTPGIENLYVMAKYGLHPDWEPAKCEQLLQQLNAVGLPENVQRLDLTDLDFISIDSAKTQDIDDALYADTSSDGWTLYVAVADPSAYIPEGSPLQAEIAARATSVYLHGDVIPMLPEKMAQDTCALREGEDRAALVCKMDISDDGVIRSFDFLEATIRSRAKLSYFAVDKYLSGEQDSLMSHASPLEALYQVFRALQTNRENTGLVMDDRREFRWVLNDQRQIESIEPFEKLVSQRLVEECMVATNRCAARFMADNGASGPFISHPGFRRDRQDELRQFLELHAPELAAEDPLSIDGYRNIMRALSAPEREQPLRAMVNRLLTRTEIVTSPAPHMGMTLPVYTNCTSPLRKYVDFLVHAQIKAILHGREATLAGADELAQVSARLRQTRTAVLEAERWLAANYLQRLAAQDSAPWTARISHISSNGFTARLEANGLEGFVDLRKDPEKFSFDRLRGTLTSKSRAFSLEQLVTVSLQAVDAAAMHQCIFQVAPQCGLKIQNADSAQAPAAG